MRSGVVYLVHSDKECQMVAAFTVKHEMWTWIEKQPDPADLFPYRMKDGPGVAEPVRDSTKNCGWTHES